MASALGIGDVLGRRPGQLSGGQRQRVAMGRAIVRRPGLFLMDEPLSNLDSGLRAELRAEITGLTRELGVTTMYVTHDQAEALTMADRVAILRKGVLQDVGTPTEVYGRPATLYVAAFLGAPRMNLLEASVYVHLDRYIALNLGEQALYLPWNDIRARAVAHYHGERIVVGHAGRGAHPGRPGRARATCCTAGSATSSTTATSRWRSWTSGRPRSWSTRWAARCTRPRSRGRRAAPLRRRAAAADRPRVERRPARTAGPTPSRRSVLSDPGRHHRRPAELAVRLAPYPAVSPGHPLADLGPDGRAALLRRARRPHRRRLAV